MPHYPLPTNPTDGAAVYDIDNTTATVHRVEDGSYYLQAYKFDSVARDAETMRQQLHDYCAQYVGWERD